MILFYLCHQLVRAALIHFLERTFIYAASTEWNKLDGRIRKITNFDSFKRETEITLFLSYFDL